MCKKLTLLFLFFSVMLFSNVFADDSLTPEETLGKALYFENISEPDWMSCATCHDPKVGFVGPNPGSNLNTAVYHGAVPQRFGNRKPPSASYATLSPVFDCEIDNETNEVLFFGGNFWDGRATGWKLGNPAADQALGPFLNPVEQNNASKQAVLMQIEQSKIAELWEEFWGAPVAYASDAEINVNYDRIGLAIAAYEGSEEVNAFTSKYDFSLKGEATLTDEEQLGLALFNDPDKGNCAACHISEGDQPLFTDFTFDNLGIPKNPDNPFYDMDEVYLDDGSAINPLGDQWIDHGLGEFLHSLADPSNQGWRRLPHVSPKIRRMENYQLERLARRNDGKHKVPSLRNVGKRPSDNFTKAYGHNGYFKSLEEIVHFYNTRDVEYWPDPEVTATVNEDELGDLGLSPEEEAALVAFMNTLSDGYDPAKDKVKNKIKDKTATLSLSGANPFNPLTRFTYTLPEDGNVQIIVYNTLGQNVAVLVDGFKQAGDYRIEFNGAHLASGIYLVRYQTEKSVLTKKVTLLK